ncbi:hypothetical protein [Aeromonas sp. CU5]|uniref:hypothetical protein n=1 Tax=Aeromonas sp. CU5 TaxID=2033033 RepID=UPI0012FD356E|nr:hypothetical protein [Aeromonas sp. CU5]
MEPKFKVSNGTMDVIAPQYIKLVVDNKDEMQLSKVVVSYDIEGLPLSYLTDDEWDFSAYIRTKSNASQKRAIWRWSSFPDAFRLPVQRLMYIHLFEFRRTSSTGLSGLSCIFRSWSVLVQLCQKYGIPNLSALDQLGMQRKLLTALSERKAAFGTVKIYLFSLGLAHRYGFTSFYIANYSQLAKKLSNLAKGDMQTLVIPQPIAVKIYSYAISRLEQWHEQRNMLASFFREYLDMIERKALPNEFTTFFSRTGFINPVIASNNKAPGLRSISTLYNDILACCGAVIGAVSGMRNGEWYELDAGSYQEETFKGITHSLLVGKTSKLNNGIPLRHAWVTAPVARLSIEVLAAVSAPRRARLLVQANALRLSGQLAAATYLTQQATSLFLALGTEGKSTMVSGVSLNRGLQRLVASVPNKDGTQGAFLRKEHLDEFRLLNRQWSGPLPLDQLWPLTTHQFRRTFAVFLLRNGFGSFLQVKQQFAHLNLSMSMWYGRNAEIATTFDMEQDVDIQVELSEMNALLMIDIAEKIYLSDEPISGRAGLNIREQISLGNRLFDSRDEIEAAVRSGDLTIIDNGHSLCLNPSCEILSCVIDPVINSVLCSHNVIMEKHAKQRVALRERLIKRHKNAVEMNINQPNLMAKTLVGIRACEKVMADHGIDYEPYGALINITIQGGV